MFPWQLNPTTLLRPFLPADIPQVHQLIGENRAHLDRWLRWSASIQTREQVADLIDGFTRKQAAGDGFHLGIWCEGQLAGGLVCWYIHRQNRGAELGYWLGSAMTGRGLATGAAAMGIEHLFTVEGMNRVEMLCGVENQASRKVAQRLGFTLEGIRRESHWITDRFVDHAVYGLLQREWLARSRTPH